MTLRLIVEPIVRAALLEDLGRAGDITTDAIVPADATVEAVIAARQPGVVAGLDAALLAFELLDPALHIERLRDDGARVARGDTVARIAGRARPVLAAERTALNLLCRMSGVATATRVLADAIAGPQGQDRLHPQDDAGAAHPRKRGGAARRRRQPPLRPRRRDADQGQPHRRSAGGVRPALERARRHAGHLVKIELEVDTLDQLAEALETGVDAVLLDNMDAADPAPRGRDGRRPRGDRSLGPDQPGNRRRRRRHRRRSDLVRLDHPQRPDPRPRPRRRGLGIDFRPLRRAALRANCVLESRR